MEYSRLPDLTFWATLRAVVEQGGVSEAARHLHIGQPAVTKRLRALDAIYKVALMERVAGRLRLTVAGEKVYRMAVQTLDRHQLLLEDIRQSQMGREVLRLQATLAIGEHLLPSILLAFNEVFPQYKVESRLAYGRSIQTDLATGMADLALMEIAPDHPDILVQKWMEDELLLVCAPGHPLAGETNIALDRLFEFSYILREPRSGIRDALDDALRRVGIGTLDVAMEVGSNEAIKDILSRNRHVSFLPRFAVKEQLERDMLKHIAVNGLRITRTLWIARNRDNLHHPVAERFIALLRQR